MSTTDESQAQRTGCGGRMGPTILYDGGKTTGNETMNIEDMAFFLTGFYGMLYHILLFILHSFICICVILKIISFSHIFDS